MSAPSLAEANFFTSLLNPGEVIARCEQSTSLNALTSQKHSADRPGRKRNSDLAAWDAAVDEGKSDAEWRRRNIGRMDDIVTANVKLDELLCA